MHSNSLPVTWLCLKLVVQVLRSCFQIDVQPALVVQVLICCLPLSVGLRLFEQVAKCCFDLSVGLTQRMMRCSDSAVRMRPPGPGTALT